MWSSIDENAKKKQRLLSLILKINKIPQLRIDKKEKLLVLNTIPHSILY